MRLSKVQHANLFWLVIGVVTGIALLLVVGPERTFPLFDGFDVPVWLLSGLCVWSFSFVGTVCVVGDPSNWGMSQVTFKGFFSPILGKALPGHHNAQHH